MNPRPIRALARVLTLLLVSTVAALAPTLPAQASPASYSAETVVYGGDGARVWRASGDLHKLHATSRSFRGFVVKRLDRLWHGYLDSDPVCARTPLVSVKAWSPDGFARISNEGTFSHGRGSARCAGGGAQYVYAVRHGRWKAVLGAQEPFACDDLQHLGVPDVIGGPSCFDRAGNLVDYHLAP